MKIYYKYMLNRYSDKYRYAHTKYRYLKEIVGLKDSDLTSVLNELNTIKNKISYFASRV